MIILMFIYLFKKYGESLTRLISNTSWFSQIEWGPLEVWRSLSVVAVARSRQASTKDKIKNKNTIESTEMTRMTENRNQKSSNGRETTLITWYIWSGEPTNKIIIWTHITTMKPVSRGAIMSDCILITWHKIFLFAWESVK